LSRNSSSAAQPEGLQTHRIERRRDTCRCDPPRR